jgi:hypothetical protein
VKHSKLEQSEKLQQFKSVQIKRKHHVVQDVVVMMQMLHQQLKLHQVKQHKNQLQQFQRLK